MKVVTNKWRLFYKLICILIFVIFSQQSYAGYESILKIPKIIKDAQKIISKIGKVKTPTISGIPNDMELIIKHQDKLKYMDFLVKTNQNKAIVFRNENGLLFIKDSKKSYSLDKTDGLLNKEILIFQEDLPYLLKDKKLIGITNNYRIQVIYRGADNKFFHKNTHSTKDKTFYIEEHPGLFVKYDDLYSDSIYFLNKNIHKEKIKILSLFDESDVKSLRYLDDVFGKIHIVGKTTDFNKLNTQLAKIDGNDIFIIAHIEKNNIVIRDTFGNSTLKIDISNLESLAEKLGKNIFILGCKSFYSSRNAGFNGNVNLNSLIYGIRNAMDNSKTYGDFFSKVARDNGQFLISTNIRDMIRLSIQAHRKEVIDQSVGGVLTIINFNVNNRTHPIELKESITNNISVYHVVFVYLTGLVLFYLLSLFNNKKIQKYAKAKIANEKKYCYYFVEFPYLVNISIN